MGREQKQTVESEAPGAGRGGRLDLEQLAPHPDAALPGRAALLVSLQGGVGNRAVSGLVQRWHEGLGEGVVQGAFRPGLRYANFPGASIQRWPSPEVDDEVTPTTFRMYKCHDAVVYWVLRSLPMTPEEAGDALGLMQRKRGPSIRWIVEALNYGSNTRLSSPPEVTVGDILFTGDTSIVLHTMVVIDANTIKGYNNFGTFGSEAGGDKYSVEPFAERRFWHEFGGGKWQIGTGKEASFPVFKVSFAPAQTALRAFIKLVASEPDYELPSVGETAETTRFGEEAKKKGCFITTAVVLTRGLPDDCDELTTLRAFRDTYVMQKPDGQQLIDFYYQHSPLILEAIAGRRNAAMVYQQLYDVIRSCVDAVKRGDDDFAFTTYCDMVMRLMARYLPNTDIGAYTRYGYARERCTRR